MRRLSSWDYSAPAGYFITIVTHKRKKVFGQLIAGKLEWTPQAFICHYYWKELQRKNPACALDAFVIMPNHVHGIIWVKYVPNEPSRAEIHEFPYTEEQFVAHQRRTMMLVKLVGKFKMQSAKHVNLFQNTSGNPLWKRGYHEHIIRNQRALSSIRFYIAQNPRKWEIRYRPSQLVVS